MRQRKTYTAPYVKVYALADDMMILAGSERPEVHYKKDLAQQGDDNSNVSVSSFDGLVEEEMVSEEGTQP